MNQIIKFVQDLCPLSLESVRFSIEGWSFKEPGPYF